MNVKRELGEAMLVIRAFVLGGKLQEVYFPTDAKQLTGVYITPDTAGVLHIANGMLREQAATRDPELTIENWFLHRLPDPDYTGNRGRTIYIVDSFVSLQQRADWLQKDPFYSMTKWMCMMRTQLILRDRIQLVLPMDASAYCQSFYAELDEMHAKMSTRIEAEVFRLTHTRQPSLPTTCLPDLNRLREAFAAG